MSVEGQNHPPLAEEIGMKQPYKYAQQPCIVCWFHVPIYR